MSEHPKVTVSHLRRAAVIYVRQSTLAQVDRNRESTARQYDLVARAQALGWPRSAVRVIDEDLGQSGATTVRGHYRGSFRVRGARRAGRAGPGRHRGVAGSIPAG